MYKYIGLIHYSDLLQQRGVYFFATNLIILDIFSIFIVLKKKKQKITSNNTAQKSSQAAQDECGFGWIIESTHREIRQLTGIKRCQCTVLFSMGFFKKCCT